MRGILTEDQSLITNSFYRAEVGNLPEHSVCRNLVQSQHSSKYLCESNTKWSTLLCWSFKQLININNIWNSWGTILEKKAERFFRMVIESTEDEPEEFESIHNLRTLKVSSKMLEFFGKLQRIEQNGAIWFLWHIEEMLYIILSFIYTVCLY